jgi:ATP-dependent DNA helicase RecQ
MNDPYIITTGFDRKNLFFSVKKPRDKMAELIGYLKKNIGKSGIVYCATRKKTDEVCRELCNKAFQAVSYHAGLTEQERRENQDDFIYDRKTIMVATNAFGMGIDKSNVNFVIHFNMPKNIESYYQEAGRAGRDGTPADCVLLYAAGDVHLNSFLLEKSVLDNDELSPEIKASILENNAELLKLMTWYCSTTDCLRAYILEYFGEKSALYCGNCQNCKTSFETVDVSIDAQKIISCVYRLKQRGRSAGRVAIARILHGSKDEKTLRQDFGSLSTFGIMADTPLKRIYAVMDYLLWEGYLMSSGGDYPVLQLAPRYPEITKDKKSVLMKLPKILPPTEKPEKFSSAGGTENYDDELFQRLRLLRSRLANSRGVPAFVVFSDATLRDMCRIKPTDRESFLEVSGVGSLKMEQYADKFTELIRLYLDEKSR